MACVEESREIDLKKLAEEVLLDLVKEKIENEGIENLIDYPRGYIVLKIDLERFVDYLRFAKRMKETGRW